MRGQIISELGDPDKKDICHLPGPALIKEKCHGKKRHSQNHPAVLEIVLHPFCQGRKQLLMASNQQLNTGTARESPNREDFM